MWLDRMRASVWSDTAASWEDLSLALPGAWNSTVLGVWHDQDTLYAAGIGYPVGGQSRALLWMRPLVPACYANCDQSTQSPILNVADFTCFLQKFAAGDSYANCDESTQMPVLNVADFTCFLQKFAAGCP